jgi:acyl carrier protein
MLASITSVSEWDSVAAISLIVVLEEEFGTEISPDEIENLISFGLVQNYLEGNNDIA